MLQFNFSLSLIIGAIGAILPTITFTIRHEKHLPSVVLSEVTETVIYKNKKFMEL